MKGYRYVTLAVSAALLLAITIGGLGEQRPPCTIFVQPGESIQAAIDQAPEGAVICLPTGIWEENIKIERSLTLRGTGAETIIDGVKWGHPVVWIMGPEEAVQTISVRVEGLMITGAEGRCVDEDKGICAHGVLIRGSAQVAITGATISENGKAGIWIANLARAEITDSTISENKADGIHLRDEAILRLVDSRILRNLGYGVSVHLPDGWAEFTGQVTGSGNLIPGPDEPNGNQKGAICPPELVFLII